MSKRTLILIVFLTILTAFFIYLAVSQNRPQVRETTTMTPTKPPVPAYTTLLLSPAVLSLSSPSGSLQVLINTGSGAKTNAVTAVQLEMQYDPKMLTNVTVTPGTFLSNVLPGSADKATGRITYAVGIVPSGSGVSGSGTVATIQFQSLLPKGGSTQLTILPTSLVTAQGVEKSVLLKATNATITFGTAAMPVSPSAMQSTSSAPITP